MKKTYEKPEIMFENFLLSTNIAGDCEKKTDTQSNNSCGMEFTGIGMVFLTDMSGCKDEKIEGDDGEYNGICYHVPYGENLFNS